MATNEFTLSDEAIELIHRLLKDHWLELMARGQPWDDWREIVLTAQLVDYITPLTTTKNG